MNDINRMKPSHRANAEQQLLAEIRKFLDVLEVASPTWDNGEEHSLSIRGARSGYSDEGHPLYDFVVKRVQEEALWPAKKR